MASEREAFEDARPRMTDHLGDVEAIRREAHAAGYRAALEAAAGLRRRVLDHPEFGGKKPRSLATAAILGALAPGQEGGGDGE